MAAAKKANGPSEELAQRLVDGITSISRHLRTVKLPEGITQERLATLALIRDRQPIAISDLATIAKVRVSSISRMMTALIEDGCVSRRDSQTDGRGVLVSLTAKGERILDRARQASVKGIRRLLDGLSKRQVAALTELSRVLQPSSIDDE